MLELEVAPGFAGPAVAVAVAVAVAGPEHELEPELVHELEPELALEPELVP